MKAIWLVVLYDRHCDDTYRSATTPEKAARLADFLMREYGTRYEWKRTDEGVEFGDYTMRGEWVYRHETFEDGPHLHIERVEVEE